MNFSEFTRWLKSDPASQDADYRAARVSGPEFIAAAAASDEFERKLHRAAALPVPHGLSESIKALAHLADDATQDSAQDPGQHPGRHTGQHIAQPTGQPTSLNTGQNVGQSVAPNAASRPRAFRWRWSYALAAGLLLVASAVLVQQQLAMKFDSVEDYVAFHFSHDGPRLLGKAENPGNAPGPGELDKLLASLHLQMRGPLASQVKFVKYCPTPEGRGIHLVMNTERGMVTVILMPDQPVQDGEHFAFDGMEASLVSLPGQRVAAAVIARPEQLDAAFSLALRDAVLPAATGT